MKDLHSLGIVGARDSTADGRTNERIAAAAREAARKKGNGAASRKPERTDKPIEWMDGALLMKMNIPDPTFVCRPWIAEGVTLVVGRPKIGKTTLLRQFTHAANTGGKFLGSPCARAEVMFLSLEEGPRLMRSKLRGMGIADESMAGVHFAFEWAKATAGVDRLRQWLRDRAGDPRIPVVIVDALARFRMPPSARGNAYTEDYNAIKLLADLCKESPGLCVLVLHHIRKMVDDDPVASISGTYGLTAAADNYLIVLKRADQYRLHAGGRLWFGDASDFELHREAGGWRVGGEWDQDAAELPPIQRRLLALLREGAKSNRVLMEATGQTASALSHAMSKLMNKGLVSRLANGWEICR